MQEKGPYTYIQYSTKFDIAFTETTQTYKTWRKLVFAPDESCDECTEDDLVTNINPVYLGALTQTQGEQVLSISLGIPYFTHKALDGKTCGAKDAVYAVPMFDVYSKQTCAAGSVSAWNSTDLNNAACCLLSDAQKTAAWLKAFEGIAGAIPTILTTGNATNVLQPMHDLFWSCGLDVPVGDGGLTILIDTWLNLLTCFLSYMGYPAPPELKDLGLGYTVAADNVLAQALADRSQDSFRNSIIDKDGLVTTKPVSQWYKGGPSPVAAMLGSSWPGFAERQHDTLEEAKADPELKFDEVISGCGGSLDEIAQYVMAQNEFEKPHGYWGVNNLTVAVGGTAGKQTTPQGVQGLGGGPYHETMYFWVEQLARPVAAHFVGSMDYLGAHVNKFSVQPIQLSGQGDAELPGGVKVSSSVLGVGHKTCENDVRCVLNYDNKAVPGLLNLTPFEGFSAFVSIPLFWGGDPVLQSNVTLSVPQRTFDEYETYTAVEPASGKTLAGHQRLQLSGMNVFSSKEFYPNSTGTIGVVLPIYWLDITASATEKDVSLLTTSQRLYTASKWSIYIGIPLGGIVLLYGIYLCCTAHDVHIQLPTSATPCHTPRRTEEESENVMGERSSSFIRSQHAKDGLLDSTMAAAVPGRCSDARSSTHSIPK